LFAPFLDAPPRFEPLHRTVGLESAGTVAEGCEHRTAPAPAAARHRARGVDSVGIARDQRFGKFAEQAGNDPVQARSFGRQPVRDGKSQSMGKPADRRQAECGRAHEGEKLERVVAGEPVETEPARRRRPVHDDRRFGKSAACRIGQPQFDDLALGRQQRGVCDARSKRACRRDGDDAAARIAAAERDNARAGGGMERGRIAHRPNIGGRGR
jgi:hypothetical protein